jgi:hypothetical protein
VPPRKKIDLPDSVRAALLADVELTYRHSLDADESSKIRIHLAIEQGITTYELEDQLRVSQQTISRWGRQGKEALERREERKGAREPAGDRQSDPDPDRSGEREPVG